MQTGGVGEMRRGGRRIEDREQAEMALLLTRSQPMSGMKSEARDAGNNWWTWNNRRFQKLQRWQDTDLLNHRKPEMPMYIPPYSRAQSLPRDAGQHEMV